MCLKVVAIALVATVGWIGTSRAQEQKSLSQTLLEYAEQVGIQATKDAATEVLKDGVLSILRMSLCNNTSYLNNPNPSAVGSLRCGDSAPAARTQGGARPDVIVRDPYSTHALFQLQGKWTAGSVAQCGRRWFTWNVVNDRFYFHNQLDQDDVEKILQIDTDSMVTRTILSSHGDSGATWKYSFSRNGVITSTNLKTGSGFTLKAVPSRRIIPTRRCECRSGPAGRWIIPDLFELALTSGSLVFRPKTSSSPSSKGPENRCQSTRSGLEAQRSDTNPRDAGIS